MTEQIACTVSRNGGGMERAAKRKTNISNEKSDFLRPSDFKLLNQMKGNQTVKFVQFVLLLGRLPWLLAPGAKNHQIHCQ